MRNKRYTLTALAISAALGASVQNAEAQVTTEGQALRTTIGTADVCLYTEGTSPKMKATGQSESTTFTWLYAQAEGGSQTTLRTTTGAADSLTIDAPGEYTLQDDSKTTTILWLSPAIDSISYAVDSATCDGLYVTVTPYAQPISAGGSQLAQELTYTWEVADSVVLTSWATELTLEDIYDEGLLTLRAQNQAYNEALFTDSVSPIGVKAAFSYTNRKENAENEASSGEALSSPAELNFTNESLGSYTVSEWAIGSIARLYDASPVYQFQLPGTFTISLTVTNEITGCASSDSSVSVTVSDAALGFPEAFTPNGDGVNDIFCPAFRSIKNYELTIFNRWGRQIYKSTDPKEGWNGKEHGRDAAAGTYFYIATAEGYEKGVRFRKKGSITLIR